MIALYAICIVLGVAGIFYWVITGLMASSLHGKAHLEPEQRFGTRGQYLIAGLSGFGLGGMSASFAGWPDGLAVVAAMAGAVAAVLAARYLGYEQDADGDSV